MKKKQIIALAVAAALFIVTGAASVLTHAAAGQLFDNSITDMIFFSDTATPPDNMPCVTVYMFLLLNILSAFIILPLF